MKICPVCQKEFEVKSSFSYQIYCSVQCREENNKIKRRKQRPKKWKYCNRRDCLYFCDTKDYNRCDYNWLTGNLRDCGRGAECTRYKHATPSERKKYRNSVLRKDEEGRNKSIF